MPRRKTAQSQSQTQSQSQSQASTTPPRNAKLVDPTGRVDIAVQRLVELGMTMHADPRIQAAYSMYQSDINRTIAQVAGPNTQIGQIASGAVSAILFINQRLEELQRHRTHCTPDEASGVGGNAA